MSVSVKPILQTLLDTEPLSAAEVREMIMRHVLSKHADPAGEEITSNLLDMYYSVCRRDNVNIDLVPSSDVERIMIENFSEAYVNAFGKEHPRMNDFWLWPVAVPRNRDLPRELCVFLGQGIGRNVGMEVRKYHMELQAKNNMSN
jgi:hypothetical protein